VAAQRLPDVTLHRADMAELDLGERFDVITCLFSSIAYVRTVPRLAAAIAAFARHLADDGVLLVETFLSEEQYWTGTVTMNAHDSDDLKITWMYTSPPPVDGVAGIDIHYLVGTPDGIEAFVERHEFGLFDDDHYRAAFAAAGLEAEHDPKGFFGRGMYVARHERRAA
jgi:SAM-dependent methyltransferase